jgi:hypothetical protein
MINIREKRWVGHVQRSEALSKFKTLIYFMNTELISE